MYNHQIDVRQEGYDKLAEDSTNVLNDTLKKIDADEETRNGIIKYQLQQLDGNEQKALEALKQQQLSSGLAVQGEVSKFITDYDTKDAQNKNWQEQVSDEAKNLNTSTIETLTQEGKKIQDAIDTDINTSLKDIAGSGDTGIAGINTKLAGIQAELEKKDGKSGSDSNKKTELTPEQQKEQNWENLKGQLIALGNKNGIRYEFDDKNKTYREFKKEKIGTRMENGKMVDVYDYVDMGKGDIGTAEKKTVKASDKAETKKEVKKVNKDVKKQKNDQATIAKIATYLANKNLKSKNGKVTDKSKKEVSDSIYTAIAKILDVKNKKKTIKAELKRLGYRKGSHSTDDEMNWLHDSEVIIRKSDGAILQPFNSGDMVFNSKMSENLWKMAQIPTETVKAMVANPDMSKFNMPGITDRINKTENNNQQIHIDSLITINGNADQQTVADIKQIARELTNSRDFQKNMTNMVTKEMTREAVKAGYRGK